VKLIVNAPEIDLISIAASSYTSIFIDDDLLVQKNMLNALTMNIPIILPDHEYFQSSFFDAALYGVESEKSLSKNMILLYKDENQRDQLIESGKLLAKRLDWNNIVSKLWSTIIESTET
jgi:glycosyltransferase involved in cell wall biosynthesis